MQFNPALHGIRAIAAIMVFLFHWNGTFPALGLRLQNIHWLNTEWDLFLFIRLGWIGVDWFFVLSGYLLAAHLWNQEITIKSTIYFWKKRAARIYPGVWAHLIILMTTVYSIKLITEIDWFQLIANMALWVQPMPYGVKRINDVFWTLPLEFAFYLMLPILVVLQRKTHIFWIITGGLAITLIWKFGLIWLNQNGYGFISMRYLRASLPGVFFVFISGFAINYLTQIKKIDLPTKNRLLILFLLFAIYYLWMALLIERRGTVPRTDWLLTIWEPIAAIIIALIIFILLKPLKGFNWLGSKPMVFLGNISFGIYLWHFPIFRLMPRIFPGYFTTPLDSLLALFYGGCLTILLAWASHEWVEKPAIRWASKK